MAIDLGPSPDAPNAAPTDAERINLRAALASTNQSWTVGSSCSENLGLNSIITGSHGTPIVATSGVTASGATITKTSHGLNNLDRIKFTVANGGTGINTLLIYYVRNKTTNTFQVSLTPSGSLSAPHGYTDGNLQYVAKAHNYGNYCSINGHSNYSNSGDYCSINGYDNYSNSGDYCSISGELNHSNSGFYCLISGESNHSNSGFYCLISGSNNSSNSGNSCSISGSSHQSNSGNYCLISGYSAMNNAHDGARIHGVTEGKRFIELFPERFVSSGGSGILRLFDGGASSNIYIPAYHTWIFKLSVALADQSSFDAKYFEFKGIAINDGIGITLQSEAVGTPILIGTNFSTTTAAITKDDATQQLIITINNTGGTVDTRALAKLEILQIYNTV